MKRIIITFTLILCLLISLSACGENYQSTYDKLNDLIDRDFTHYDIVIFVHSSNGNSSDTIYSVTEIDGERTISYSSFKINEFIVDGDSILAPDEYSSYEEGTIHPDDVNSYKYAVPNFNFSKSTLKGMLLGNGMFMAEILSLEGFMGLDIDVEKAEVSVQFNDEKIEHINIFYVSSNNNEVTITYHFDV